MVYILNGYNLEEKFGVIITNGVNPLLALPERKDSVANDWQDQDGLDIDLAVPKFKARQFVFNCLLKADTPEKLRDQYFGLFGLLKRGGSYTLYNDFLNMTVEIYYMKFTPTENLYSTSEGGFAMKFDLQFGETDPYGNIPIVFMVDDQDRFLIQ